MLEATTYLSWRQLRQEEPWSLLLTGPGYRQCDDVVACHFGEEPDDSGPSEQLSFHLAEVLAFILLRIMLESVP